MLDELESLLAQLYPSTDAAKLVVDKAGIPAAHIDLDGPPAFVWHRIIEQADRRGKVPDLLRVVLKDFPNQVKLQQMLGAFLYPPREQESLELPMSARGDEGYHPRLGERVARLEERTDRGFENLNDKLDSQAKLIADLTLAIAAKPVPTAEQAKVYSAIRWIGVGIAILAILLLALWLQGALT